VVSALERVSAGYPGTPVSGLAQLAAGLALLDAQKAKESLPLPSFHPDIQRTLLSDHAILALGHAQEALQQMDGAGQSYPRAAAIEAWGPLVCTCLEHAGEDLRKGERAAKGSGGFRAAGHGVSGPGPKGAAADRRGAGSARRANRRGSRHTTGVDREFHPSVPAHDTAPRLNGSSGPSPPAASPAERAARGLSQGLAFVEAGRNTDGRASLPRHPGRVLSEEEADLARVAPGPWPWSLARYCLAEAESALLHVKHTSGQGPEAAYPARPHPVSAGGSTDGFEQVAQQHAGTPWAEEALLALANEYQRTLGTTRPCPTGGGCSTRNPEEGKYASSGPAGATRPGPTTAPDATRPPPRPWSAPPWLRPPSAATPGFLYWAGTLAGRPGQIDRARPAPRGDGGALQETPITACGPGIAARLPAAPATAPPQDPRGRPLGRAGAGSARAPGRARPPAPAQIGSTRPRPSSMPCPFSRGASHHRLDRLAPRPHAARHRRHETRVSRVDRREAGDRLAPRGLAHPLPDALRRDAPREGRRGRARPVAVAALILQESTFDADALQPGRGPRPVAMSFRPPGASWPCDPPGPLSQGGAPRPRHQPGFRHPLPSSDFRPLRRTGGAGPWQGLQCGAASRGRLDGRNAAGDVPPEESHRGGYPVSTETRLLR